MIHVSSGALQPVFYALIACGGEWEAFRGRLGALVGIATLLSSVLWALETQKELVMKRSRCTTSS